MTSKQYPNFETTNYFYDANNQPVEMDEYKLGGTKALATLYTWDPNGNLLNVGNTYLFLNTFSSLMGFAETMRQWNSVA